MKSLLYCANHTILYFIISTSLVGIFTSDIARPPTSGLLGWPYQHTPGAAGYRTARGLQYSGPVITLRVQHGQQIQYNTIQCRGIGRRTTQQVAVQDRQSGYRPMPMRTGGDDGHVVEESRCCGAHGRNGESIVFAACPEP